MRHRKQHIVETAWVNLNSVTHPKTGRKHYEISVNGYRLSLSKGWGGTAMAEMRKHFDPAGNRGAKLGTKWKYRNREQAEQLITMALLKWGA